jgi:hypothetical protein
MSTNRKKEEIIRYSEDEDSASPEELESEPDDEYIDYDFVTYDDNINIKNNKTYNNEEVR